MTYETQMLLGLFLGIFLMVILVLKTKTHTFTALLLAALITGIMVEWIQIKLLMQYKKDLVIL